MRNCIVYIKKIIVFVYFFGLFGHNAWAQLPSIKSSVDKDNILIGQQLNLKIETSMPGNIYRLSWFSIPDSFGNFVIVTKNKIDSASSNGNLNFSQVLTITNFDSGRQVIPPLRLVVSTLEDDSSFNIYTDSFPVNVSYSPMDSIQPFHDIKTILEVKKEWPWWAWPLVVLGIIILIGAIIFLAKFLKKKKTTESLFTSKISAYDEAMQSLSELEKNRSLEAGKVKEFHFRLTEIFKRYLSRKSNSYKLHLTTDEILIDLNDVDLPKEQISGFASALRMGSAVKFAQYIPPAYENEKCLLQTKEIITALNTITNQKATGDI